MKLSLWAVGLVVLGGPAAFGQDAVRVAPLEVKVDLSKFETSATSEALIRRAYREALASEVAVEFASARELAATMEVLECSDSDYDWNDDSLGRVAYASGMLYALYVSVEVDESGLLAATAVLQGTMVGVWPRGLLAQRGLAAGSPLSRRRRCSFACSVRFRLTGSQCSNCHPPSTAP